MAGMQRFVTYIYAYDDGQKSSNTGYAKIEIRGNIGRIEIHFMNGGISRGNAQVSVLFAKDRKLIFLPFGEFFIDKGAGMFKASFQTEHLLDSPIDFTQIDGIFIADSNDRIYLSFWRDINITEITTECLIPYKAEEEESVAEPKTESQKESVIPLQTESQKEPVIPLQTEPQKESVMPLQTEPQKEPVIPLQTESQKEPVIPFEAESEEETKQKAASIEEAELESLHTMEIPMRNIFPEYSIGQIWEKFMKRASCEQINEEACAVRIELKELRELPKKYWYLGNNSFLLHGFFNYQHLLFGKMADGNWFLGVPGVYQRQERVMASIFGFPGFLPIEEISMQKAELSMEENREGREMKSGVWYHILED